MAVLMIVEVLRLWRRPSSTAMLWVPRVEALRNQVAPSLFGGVDTEMDVGDDHSRP
jgi:hypothetical protein